jgi:hypothetical protein
LHPAEDLSITQSEFEAEVLQVLSAKGLATIPQFRACDFFIDMVVTKDGKRLAIECDGEAWHLDEHRQMKEEDLLDRTRQGKYPPKLENIGFNR